MGEATTEAEAAGARRRAPRVLPELHWFVRLRRVVGGLVLAEGLCDWHWMLWCEWQGWWPGGGLAEMRCVVRRGGGAGERVVVGGLVECCWMRWLEGAGWTVSVVGMLLACNAGLWGMLRAMTWDPDAGVLRTRVLLF